MSLSVVITLIALGIAVLLGLLFWVEEKRGRPLALGGFRTWVDRKLETVHPFLARTAGKLGAGTLRVWMHYCVHTVLKACRSVLQRLEAGLARLQRRNRAAAKSVTSDRNPESHLGSVAEHKDANRLSESEKRVIREKHLQG